MPFSGDYSGYELDTSFIEESHHTNPRRLYSTYGADWQYRVDHEDASSALSAREKR